MLASLVTLLPKIAFSIMARLFTEKALEELILFALKKLAKSTKTKIDDQVFELVEKHLKK